VPPPALRVGLGTATTALTYRGIRGDNYPGTGGYYLVIKSRLRKQLFSPHGAIRFDTTRLVF
jgi:hypothetical protein